MARTEAPIADAAPREAALEPQRSFIVQAPAGSGKTELLVQRVLTLLARVDEPEEIVAITFTRKAAAEMRARILEALQLARGSEPPAEAYRRAAWALGAQVLARDAERGWDLSENPGRLRIQTIDSLCAALTRQMPVLSCSGLQLETLEDAAELYVEAARRTLLELESGGGWSEAIALLLDHLDNNLPRVEGLIAAMLGRRDQWLRHVFGGLGRAELEGALANLVSEHLSLLRALVPADLVPELLACARFAAGNLGDGDPNAAIRACAELTELPGSAPGDAAAWQGLATLLLTATGGWRRQVDRRLGFPAAGNGADAQEKALYAEMKQRAGELLEGLAGEDALAAALERARVLPPACYEELQWAVTGALLELLQLAAAQLRVVFAERGAVDFAGVAEAAVQSLGSPQEPTDLALALDYRIRHLLVDEFQDTSVSQYELLVCLTAGWEPGDGRTLFLVGDPMQSIYRFREAEVGLFLKTRRAGRLGGAALTPLTLRVNFRAQAELVTWVNDTFPEILPQREDIGAGAVTYSASQVFHGALDGPGVQVHPYVGEGDEAEAGQVLRLVAAAAAEHPGGTTAILVRGRSHLAAIVPRLKAAGVRFRALDIEHLGHRPVVQDLLALTRALAHRADRVAWLALLRAPWCGLSLADLEALAGAHADRCLWELVCDPQRTERLSADGQRRLARVREVLQAGESERGRRSLRDRIEGAWLALGGPACCADAADLDNAAAFLELLEGFDEGADLGELGGLAEAVDGLFAAPDPQAGAALQVMTVHKAKGLEFDTVIVPGLGRGTGHDDPRLLRWLERPRAGGETDLLLAPIRAAGAPEDPIYRYLGVLEKDKQRFEDGRLLYVAATRAIRRLHLLGRVAQRGDGTLGSPAAGSLLSQLWPAVQALYAEAGTGTPAPALPEPGPPCIRRLPAAWERPAPPPSVPWEGAAPPAPGAEPIEFIWASPSIRHVGTVVHALLQRIGNEGLRNWPERRVRQGAASVRARLRLLGVGGEELEAASARVIDAVTATLADERGRWVLDDAHAEARSEYALSGYQQGRLVNAVIDRTFVDANGIRWIVDYKTSIHEGGDVERFLDNEQARYRAQLERYAALIGGIDSRPIRLGLYFPLLGAWRSWEPQASADAGYGRP